MAVNRPRSTAKPVQPTTIVRRYFEQLTPVEDEDTSKWMRALETAGIPVPRVIRSRHGRDFEVVAMPAIGGARQIDVFEWIDGRQLGSVESGVSGEGADSEHGNDQGGQELGHFKVP